MPKQINRKFLILPVFAIFLSIFLAPAIMAHCPLCTIGAGAAGAAAVWLGVSKVVVALFLGAFSMSMGMWFSRIPKKEYFPMQKAAIIIVVFLATLIPLLPFFKAIGPLYLSFVGEYGKTYAVNYSLGSGLLGALIVFVAPPISRAITKKRNGKTIPFQGTLLTIVVLIVIGVLIQFSLPNSGASGEKSSIEFLSPEEFEQVIQNEEIFLLNTHTPYEGQINGTDLILKDWQNVENQMSELPTNLSTPIAVYCRSGRMSGEIAKELKKMGYKEIYDLEGGMIAWEESGREIIP